MSKTQKSAPAFSLKTLGGASPTFDLPVSIGRRDGDDVCINLKVKGLRKSAWAAHRDEYLAAVRPEGKPADVEFSFATQVGVGVKELADLIVKAAAGWDLEDALTAENIVELEDLLPGAIQAILTKIDIALFQGRLGN